MLKLCDLFLLASFSGVIACTSGKVETADIQQKKDLNFELIHDFEENRALFRADTFELSQQSTDGGELIAYHGKDMDYLVLDAWIYGETGKQHAIFWTDTNMKIRLAQRTLYEYDRPYYEGAFRTDETTEYFSFTEEGFRHYDVERKESTAGLAEKQEEIQSLLDDFLQEVEIVK
jgi:hypothetical protein